MGLSGTARNPNEGNAASGPRSGSAPSLVARGGQAGILQGYEGPVFLRGQATRRPGCRGSSGSVLPRAGRASPLPPSCPRGPPLTPASAASDQFWLLLRISSTDHGRSHTGSDAGARSWSGVSRLICSEKKRGDRLSLRAAGTAAPAQAVPFAAKPAALTIPASQVWLGTPDLWLPTRLSLQFGYFFFFFLVAINSHYVVKPSSYLHLTKCRDYSDVKCVVPLFSI
uniref:uncharacterized protein LOC128929265 n=1 Tax=Callithrix jacchus TaxID=9483 RepID=UPI0023DD1571|nr:uncharacterized protein LOC128929265 [Callithrix jacchus]